MQKAKRIYGDPVPEVVKARLDRELNSIIGNWICCYVYNSSKLVTNH